MWEAVRPKPALPIPESKDAAPKPPSPRTANDPGAAAKRPDPEEKPAAVEYLSKLLGVGLVLGALTSGCVGPRPLKGGQATVVRRGGGQVEQVLLQGENASQPTRQDQQALRERSYTVPAGSRLEETSVVTLSEGRLATNLHTVVVSAPMPVLERESTRAMAELGAAQKDTARELAVRLSNLRGVTWLGAGLFVFGIASLAWPPLKAIVGSVTTSGALMAGGLALIFLPGLVGHETLILGAVALGVGAWFVSYRHGKMRGEEKLKAKS